MTETNYGTGKTKLFIEKDGGDLAFVGDFDDVVKASTHVKAQAKKGDGTGTKYHVVALKRVIVIG